MREESTIKGMHVGASFSPEDEDLVFCRQMGVDYVSASPPMSEEEGYWEVDALVRFREHIESFGLKLAAMSLPRQLLRSSALGTPGRDRDIEQVCKCIEAAGTVGIPVLGYHLGDLGVVRNPGRTFGQKPLIYSCYGRGGVMSPAFDYSEMKEGSPHPAGPISAEQAWERIEYFIERVVPVAEEYKVKMACHPNDVPVPPGTSYRGVVPVLNSIDGLKRFIDLHPSPYHGIVFCQGCVSEFSTNPEQVYEAIRYFGSRQKIFWVHFRNIRGGLGKFEETFPDEGDIDMVKALRIYKEVGYNGALVADHVPHSLQDTPLGHRSRAYCLGYIKALIQAIESENP